MTTASESATTTAMPPGRKRIFAFYLFFSLAIHAVTVLVVLFSTSSSQPVIITNYIDIANPPLPPAAPPEIHAPAPAVVEKETSEPEIEQPNREEHVEKDAPTEPVSPEILSTPLGLGMAHGFFKSLAEGKTLRDEIRVYYFEILGKINTIWWQKAGSISEVAQQEGIVDISIGPDGAIQGARLARTTGSTEVDRAIIEALREASPFPPPPVSMGQDSFRAPLRIAVPSNLFRLGNR